LASPPKQLKKKMNKKPFVDKLKKKERNKKLIFNRKFWGGGVCFFLFYFFGDINWKKKKKRGGEACQYVYPEVKRSELVLRRGDNDGVEERESVCNVPVGETYFYFIFFFFLSVDYGLFALSVLCWRRTMNIFEKSFFFEDRGESVLGVFFLLWGGGFSFFRGLPGWMDQARTSTTSKSK
jgi:hypothetical protein